MATIPPITAPLRFLWESLLPAPMVSNPADVAEIFTASPRIQAVRLKLPAEVMQALEDKNNEIFEGVAYARLYMSGTAEKSGSGAELSTFRLENVPYGRTEYRYFLDPARGLVNDFLKAVSPAFPAEIKQMHSYLATSIDTTWHDHVTPSDDENFDIGTVLVLGTPYKTQIPGLGGPRTCAEDEVMFLRGNSLHRANPKRQGRYSGGFTADGTTIVVNGRMPS